MEIIRPYRLFIVGFILVLFGFLVPFLTVVKVIESNLILLLASYAASMAGLFLGMVAVAYYFKPRR